MPREGANRLAQIAEALQWDRGRWIWLLLILLILDLVLALGDSVGEALRYDRGAIAAGGWWRLLTAHIVHLDLHHLMLNELGLVLMWSLFAQDYDPVEWCVIVLSGALAISSGLWWLSPRVAWYVGASGVLHSIMAAGVRQASRRARLGSLDSARCACAPNSRTSSWEAASRPWSSSMPICTAPPADLRSVLHSPGGSL